MNMEGLERELEWWKDITIGLFHPTQGLERELEWWKDIAIGLFHPSQFRVDNKKAQVEEK